MIPLPEPRTLSRGDEDGPIQLGYTAEQMHAYAAAAVAAERADLRAKAQREAAGWRQNFEVLQRALVGDTGASGITVAAALRKDAERLRGEVAFLRATMEGVAHQLTRARIWGGMEWHYNPLHPMHYKPALDRLREVLDRTRGGAA